MAFGQDVEVALSLAEDAVVGEVSPRKELSGVLQHCLVAADWPAPWPGADVVVACGQSGGRSRVLVGCGDGGGIGALDGVGLLELGQSLSLGGSLLVASAEPTRGLAAGGLRLRGGANACDQWIECATVGQAHWLYLRADSLDAHLELRRAGEDEYLSTYYRCVGTGECVWGIGDRVGAEVVQPGWVGKTLIVGSDGEQFVADGIEAWSEVFAAPSPQYMWLAVNLMDGPEDVYVNMHDRRLVCRTVPPGGVLDRSAHPGLAMITLSSAQVGMGGFAYPPLSGLGYPLPSMNGDAEEGESAEAHAAQVADSQEAIWPGDGYFASQDAGARSRSGSERSDD